MSWLVMVTADDLLVTCSSFDGNTLNCITSRVYITYKVVVSGYKPDADRSSYTI